MKNTFNIKTLAAIVALFLVSLRASAQFSGGNGTENNPYIITTPAQLAQLATLVNEGNTNYNDKHYILGNDLDLSEYGEDFNGGAGWIPIGVNNSFRGVFDGNNKIITSLYIRNTSFKDIGLFGVLEEGMIKNLGVVDVEVNDNNSTNIGGVVGCNFYSSVLNCYNTGYVSGTYVVGGVVGWNYVGIVLNCYSASTLNVLGVTTSTAGGVVGMNGFGTVCNSYSISILTASGLYGANIGGVVGLNYIDGIISNCAALNPGMISTISNGFFGRIIGQNLNNNCTLTNNIAFENMLNPAGSPIWDKKGESNSDGKDINIESILTDGTLGGRFTTENGWTTQNGKLPGLFSQTVDMPEHLWLPLPAITTSTLPNGEVGITYNQTLTADCGVLITWSLESGFLPKGLDISTDGTISGTPTTAGTYYFTVKATNLAGFDTKDLSIVINPGSGISNNPFSQNLTAFVQNGDLYISGLTPGEKWYIYSISGIMVYEDIAVTHSVETRNALSQQLPTGIYIIKSGTKTTKIIIK